jgi:UDP-galactose transporter B1
VYLFGGFAIMADKSELAQSARVFFGSTELRYDIMMFCICAGVGQVLIFKVMKEFGSLAWIAISITRKLFTILVSVFMFGHPVKPIQWLGIFSVFLGITVEAGVGYLVKSNKEQQAAVAAEKKKK